MVDILDPAVYEEGDPESNGLPLSTYARLRDQAPCYLHETQDPAYRERVWVVTRHEDIVRIDRDVQNFVNAHGVNFRKFGATAGSMIFLDGADHRRHRNVLRSAFTPRAVSVYAESFRVLAREIVARALRNESFDLVEEISVEMPLNVICDLLDVPRADRRQFLAWINAFAVTTDPRFAPTPEAAMDGVASTRRYALDLAEARRANPGPDLLSKLVSAVDTGSLDEDELQAFAVLLAGAGTDTTRNALSHGIHALIRNPEQMAWLRDRADDIPRGPIEEIVRWASPVIHFGRTVVNDTQVAGQEVRAGEFVVMVFPAGNFDPAAFDEPAAFDLSRGPNPHVSFGVGPHSCLGRHVALLEVKVLLEELLHATSRIEQAGPIRYTRDSRLRGVHNLPVTVTRA
jgi:cholest-4-en-3-one 26-monooxygenase